jgi:hypothetical protein
MATRYRNIARKHQPGPKPEYALCVIVRAEIPSGVEYLPNGLPVGYITRMDVAHPQTKSQLAKGLIRLFDPATDSRGPSFPFRNLWTREDSVWYPETEGWWAVRVKPEHCNVSGAHMRFQYGTIDHPRYSLAAAREAMERLRKDHPEFAAQCEIVKLPCVMSNPESHIVCE